MTEIRKSAFINSCQQRLRQKQPCTPRGLLAVRHQNAMKTSKAKPFVIAAVLFSAGCVNLLVHAFFIFSFFCFFWPSIFVLPRRSEGGRSFGDSRLDWVFGISLIIAFVTVNTLIVLGKMQVPVSVTERVLCHPAFVIPLWVSLMSWLCWRWRKERRLSDV